MDKKHGQGTFSWSDGRKYVGGWKDGKQHGDGVFTDENGISKKGKWNEGTRLDWSE